MLCSVLLSKKIGDEPLLGRHQHNRACHFRHITWPSSDVQTVFSLGSSAVNLLPAPSSESRGGDRPHGNALNTAGAHIPCSRAHMLPTQGPIDARHLKSLPSQLTQGLSQPRGQEGKINTCEAGTRVVLGEEKDKNSLQVYPFTQDQIPPKKKKSFGAQCCKWLVKEMKHTA